MSNIADRIETFILRQLEQDKTLVVKRGDLAMQLSCAPSQITYVLQSRFSPDKGFHVESRRGIGGGIVIRRMRLETRHTPMLTNSLPVLIEETERAELLPPQQLEEVDRWLGHLLLRERLQPREARMLHATFEALFHLVPREVSEEAIHHVYRAVHEEIGGV